jgi:hypothetical protein
LIFPVGVASWFFFEKKVFLSSAHSEGASAALQLVSLLSPWFEQTAVNLK